MTQIHGHCDPRFESLRTTFAGLHDGGEEIGSSVAVVLEGELVVDLWAGHLDEARSLAWRPDTLVNVYSTTKTMCNLSALVLADRGELDLDAPVSRYWPEFKSNGKDGVLVRQLLAHTAGLPGWQEALSAEDLYDWAKCTELLAAQAPWWEPGSRSGYHALTQGYLVGEVVRRVSGLSLGQFFAKQIAEPLGADFHIGTGPELDERVGLLVPPPPAEAPTADPDSIAGKVFFNPPIDARQSQLLPWRRAEIPAANGHGNARSVALVQSLVSNGGETNGVRVLSAQGVEAIFREQANGQDLVLGMPVRLGIGYGLKSQFMPLPGERSCFWGGYGGSIVISDLDRRMTIAYVMNRMGSGVAGDLRGLLLSEAAFSSQT